MSELPCYTILSLPTDLEAPNEQQLKSDLEKGDTKTKIAALKKVLHLILNGDKIPGILMTIIRFVLPSQVSKYNFVHKSVKDLKKLNPCDFTICFPPWEF